MAQKWEYKTYRGVLTGKKPQDFDDEIRLMLNQSGDEGWELVGTEKYVSGGIYVNEYTFKRPKED